MLILHNCQGPGAVVLILAIYPVAVVLILNSCMGPGAFKRNPNSCLGPGAIVLIFNSCLGHGLVVMLILDSCTAPGAVALIVSCSSLDICSLPQTWCNYVGSN